MKKPLNHWKANFFTGLAVVLPALLSIGAVVWLFGTVSNFTDALLFFLPKDWTHERGGEGPMRWYWSLFALALAIGLITLVGRFARHYLGKKLIMSVADGIKFIISLGSVAPAYVPPELAASAVRPVVAGNAPVVGEGGDGAAFAVPKLSAEPVADSRCMYDRS